MFAPSKHSTDRVVMPPPHPTLHAVHPPKVISYEGHGNMLQPCSADGLILRQRASASARAP
eukprot:8931980-Pyramimonas_sp.AAC.1